MRSRSDDLAAYAEARFVARYVSLVPGGGRNARGAAGKTDARLVRRNMTARGKTPATMER